MPTFTVAPRAQVQHIHPSSSIVSPQRQGGGGRRVMLAASPDTGQATPSSRRPQLKLNALARSSTQSRGRSLVLYASVLGGHLTLLSARTYRFVGRMSWNMGS